MRLSTSNYSTPLSILLLFSAAYWIMHSIILLSHFASPLANHTSTIALPHPKTQTIQISTAAKNLFGINNTNIAQSALAATIIGIISNGQQHNKALIDIDKQQQWYQVGDHLQDNIIIVRIEKNAVILTVDGKLEKLQMPQAKALLDRPLLNRQIFYEHK